MRSKNRPINNEPAPLSGHRDRVEDRNPGFCDRVTLLEMKRHDREVNEASRDQCRACKVDPERVRQDIPPGEKLWPASGLSWTH